MAECIEWTGARDTFGYGNLNVGGKFWKAHRHAWVKANGEIPKGICVLHKCDNPPCVNPEHLFLGTKLDNYRDMRVKGREKKAHGEGHGNCRFSDEDVRRIREMCLFGAMQIDIAAAWGCSQGTIGNIVRRKSRRNVE